MPTRRFNGVARRTAIFDQQFVATRVGSGTDHKEWIQAGTNNVRRRLARLNATIEDSELEVSGFAPRKRELRDGEQKLQEAEREAETALSESRPVMEHIDGIGAFARELDKFQKGSYRAERRV